MKPIEAKDVTDSVVTTCPAKEAETLTNSYDSVRFNAMKHGILSRLVVLAHEDGVGFADLLATLDENPLPVVLLVQPDIAHSAPEAASELRQRFTLLPETDLAQIDLQWVQRLAAILDTARRGILIIKRPANIVVAAEIVDP